MCDILLSDGWHGLEDDFDSKKSWRWTKNNFSIKLFSDIDSFTINAGVANISHEIKIYGIYNDQTSYVELKTLFFNKDDQVKIDVDVKNITCLRIKTNAFIPKNIIVGSDDSRSLGIMVYGFTIFKNKQNSYVKIQDVPNVDDENIYSGDNSIYLNVDKYFKRTKLETNSKNIDNVTVILTCHSDEVVGDRVNLGKNAYNSILNSGIKNIVITMSGKNKEYIRWAESLRDKHEVIISHDQSKTNNDCWIEGLKLSKTYWSIILHDDDIMLPSVQKAISHLDEECLFGIWQGNVTNFYSENIELDKTIDLNLKTGKYNTDVLKNLILQNKSAISPIHGIFPTSEYIKSLENWQSSYGQNNFFKPFTEKPQFVVGNDYYIWCHFLEMADGKFLYFDEKCVKCISHEGSSTQIDLSKKNPKFYDIYDHLKNIHIKNDIKVGCLMYINQLDSGIKQSIQNLSEYKMSKYNIPFIFYSDDELTGIKYQKINKIEKMDGGYYRIKDKYAFWSFVEAIKIAREKNWDYFFIYEWDCKVGKDYWFDTIWQEHLSWSHKPIITGTPAVRYPKSNIGNFCKILETYSYNYSKECHVSLNVDLASPISLYTNGALTFYDTNELCNYYRDEIDNKIIDKNSHVDEVGPWDFGLGIRIFKKLKEESFKRVGWLPSVYSGCGDFCYNQTQRDLMLKSGLKAVIHQHKYI